MRKLGVLALGALFLAACGSTAAPAAPASSGGTPAASVAAPAGVQAKLDDLNKKSGADRQTFLEDQAKKEGKVVLYTSADPDTITTWNGQFKAKYPSIDAQFVRMTTADLLQKSTAESKAGKPVADLLNPPAAELAILQQANMLARYTSPESKGFAPQFVDKNGTWTDGWYVPEVVAFNTKQATKAEVPTTLDALANPALKGKLGRTTLGDRWVAAVLKVKGETEGTDLLKKIAANQPRLYDSNTALANALASGQVAIAFDIHLNNTAKLIKDGAPVEQVVPDPLFVYSQYFALPKDAPHPYAAALVYDWMLSKDGGQGVIASHDQIGARTDTDYPHKDVIAAAKTIVDYGPDLLVPDKVQGYGKTFEDLFVRK